MEKNLNAQEQISARFTQDCVEVALLTISVYDFVLCFSDEVAYIWFTLPKLSLSPVIYVIVRYFPLAKIIFLICAPGDIPRHCTAICRFIEFFDVIARTGMIATLFLQAYVVCGCSLNYALTLLAVLDLACLTLNCCEVFNTSCVVTDPRVVFVSPLWGTLVSSVRLVAEILGIGVVLYIYHSHVKITRLIPGRSLFSFVFEHCFLCFTATFILEVSSIIFSLPILKPCLRGLLIELPLPILSIFMSRFLLNLRRNASRINTVGVWSVSFTPVTKISLAFENAPPVQFSSVCSANDWNLSGRMQDFGTQSFVLDNNTPQVPMEYLDLWGPKIKNDLDDGDGLV